MGGALAALGLLIGCRSLDDDSAYYPRSVGTYLRVDTSLWWVPEEAALVRLPLAVQGLSAADRWAIALHESEVYFFRPGQLSPMYRLALREPGTCLAARVEKKTLTLYIGTASGLLIGETQLSKPLEGIKWSLEATPAPVHAVAVAPSFTVAAAGQQLLVLDAAANRRIQTLELPGPIHRLWIEHPTGTAGLWQGRDTLYSFAYLYQARQLSVETAQPSAYRYRLTSPYLRANFGTEYTGAINLSAAGLLSPGEYTGVEDFAADFLGGRIFFLRRDSLWSYAIAAPDRLTLKGTFAGAQAIEAVPVYRYGSAEVTTR